MKDPRDVLLAGVEAYIAALSDDDFTDLTARTRDPESKPANSKPDPAAEKAAVDDELYQSIYTRR